MGILNYTYQDIIKKLRKLGFSLIKQSKGSHEIRYSEEIGVSILLPHHSSTNISKGVISQIIHRIGITNQEFKDL